MGAELRRLNRLKFFRLCTSVKGTENWHKDKDKTERHADDLFIVIFFNIQTTALNRLPLI